LFSFKINGQEVRNPVGRVLGVFLGLLLGLAISVLIVILLAMFAVIVFAASLTGLSLGLLLIPIGLILGFSIVLLSCLWMVGRVPKVIWRKVRGNGSNDQD